MNEWLQKIRKVEKNLYEILENDENKKKKNICNNLWNPTSNIQQHLAIIHKYI